MGAFGIQYFIHALAASAPALGPPWTPAPQFWGYVTAIILVAAAAGIATGAFTRCAAISLGILLLVRVLLAYVPRLAANIHDPGPWTSGSELLALCGAALVLAGVMNLGRILFAAPLLVFGVQHFLYARFIATLVPAWIPGRLFWAYFIGGLFYAPQSLSHSRQRRVVSGNSVGPHVFSVGAHPPSAQSGCGAAQRK